MASRKKAETEAQADSGETLSGELIKFEGLSAERAPVIFGHGSLGDFVAVARAAVINEVPDLSTDKGRKRIASLAAQVSRSKTAVSELGVDYLRVLKAQPKVIEGELSAFREAMDALRDEVRAPLNEWQAQRDAEDAAKQAIIDQIMSRLELPEDTTAEQIGVHITALECEPLPEEIGSRAEEAESKIAYVVGLLKERQAKRQQYEREQAELIESRRRIAALEEEKRIKEAAELAVKEERERNERQQQEQRDATAKAQREAEDAKRRAEQEIADANQRAEEEKRLAQERADKAAADARQQALDEAAAQRRAEEEEAAQKQRDDEARAANRAHCGAINKAALDALLKVNMSGEGQPASYLSEVEAKAIIAAIIRQQIPAVSITY